MNPELPAKAARLVEEFARRISGESLSALVVSALPEAQRRVLQRAAAAGLFDAELYYDLLRGPDGPDLADLERLGQVEPAPARRYQVCETFHDGAWESWWTDARLSPDSREVPADLRALSARLAARHRRAGQGGAELRQLMIADQAAARRRFVELYREADDRLDLAACQGLLNVLGAPDLVRLLDPATAQLRDDFQLQLETRSLWYLEHYQSERYLPRPELEAALLGLLRAEPSRVLALNARGGMGKTMQLRWFIARYCLTRSIPCARLDFDVIDPMNAIRHPWLLLLEAANQLNRQLPRAPFEELLKDHGVYLPVLSRQPAEVARFGSAGLAPAGPGDADGDAVVLRFHSTLAERGADEPVVVVLDTLEEVILRPGIDPRRMLERLAELRREVRAVRLVLSGRYDLRERIPGFAELFDDAVTMRVQPFTDEQARRYLVQVRGIDRPDLVTAAVHKADGLPFTLAVFGDLIHRDPGLDADDIADSDDPALLYAIERVVERVDDDRLQWLLRYGVVPRRLSYDFFTNVMRPFLAAGMTGSGRDHPDREARPGHRPLFRTGQTRFPEHAAELRALWDQLTRYASDYSWLSVSQTEPDTVVIHDDVTRPLRRLLSRQPVFRDLHQHAARYYAGRAETGPGRWLADTVEALYHRVQAGEEDAHDFWRRAIGRARQAGRLDWVSDLAAEVLGPDYLDNDAGLPGSAENSVVGRGFLIEAHLERARAAAEQARAAGWPGDHPAWSEAEGALAAARALAGADPATRVPAGLAAIIQSSLLLARGSPAGAAGVIAPLAASDEVTMERRDAVLLLAAANRALGARAGAQDLLRQAYDLSQRLHDGAGVAAAALALSRAYLDDDITGEAVRWAATAEAAAVGQVDARRARLAQAQAWVSAGRPGAALSVVRGLDGPDVDHLRARALLALRRPAEALDRGAAALADLDRLPPNAAPQLLGVLGGARGEVLDFDGAQEALTDAIDLCRTLQDLEGAARWGAAAARQHLTGTGNLLECAQLIDEAERLSTEPGGEAWLRVRLIRAILLDRQDHTTAAMDLLDTADSVLTERVRGAGSRVRVAVAGLCLRGQAGRYLPMLLTSLAALPEGSRRLVLLRDLRYCTDLHGARPADVERFRALAATPADPVAAGTPGAALAEEADRVDEAALGLVRAEILRLAGATPEATRAVHAAATELSRYDPFVWWDWLQAMTGIGPVAADQPMPPPPGIAARYPGSPVLIGAYLTGLASLRAPIDPPEVTAERLREAARHYRLGPRRIHRFEVRHAEAVAQIAERRGDRVEAARARAHMVSVLTELGHPVEDRAREFETPVAPAAGDREVAVTLTLAGPIIGAVVAPPGGAAAEARWAAPPDVVDGGQAGGPVLTTAAGLAQDWAEWMAAAGRDLAAPLDAALRDQATPCDVRLTLDAAPLHGLPWELLPATAGPVLCQRPEVRFCYRAPGRADARHAETRTLQQALRRCGWDPGPIDGLFGRLTQRAVRMMQASRGLPGSGVLDAATWQTLRELQESRSGPAGNRVLILRPSLERSLRTQRGTHGSGIDISRGYAGIGMVVDVLENPAPESLDRYVEQHGADLPVLVHVMASMEGKHGTVYLDFSAEQAYSESAYLSSRPERVFVTLLARLIQRLGAERTPLTVLDVAAPPTRTEALRQLVLRNTFAQQLLQLGGTHAVLATGLAAPPDQLLLYDLLVTAIGDGRSAADIARALQHHRPVASHADILTLLPFAGTALLSVLPPQALTAVRSRA